MQVLAPVAEEVRERVLGIMIDYAQEQRVSEFSGSAYSLLHSFHQHAMSKGGRSIEPALSPSAVVQGWLKRRERDHVNASQASARMARN